MNGLIAVHCPTLRHWLAGDPHPSLGPGLLTKLAAFLLHQAPAIQISCMNANGTFVISGDVEFEQEEVQTDCDGLKIVFKNV